MALIAYFKSYEFLKNSYTAHSTNKEKDGFSFIFNFFNNLFYSTYSILNSYTFVNGRKNSDHTLTNSTNNFTVHHPQVSRKKSKDLAYVLLNI